MGGFDPPKRGVWIIFQRGSNSHIKEHIKIHISRNFGAFTTKWTNITTFALTTSGGALAAVVPRNAIIGGYFQALCGRSSRCRRTKWRAPLNSARPKSWEKVHPSINFKHFWNLNTPSVGGVAIAVHVVIVGESFQRFDQLSWRRYFFFSMVFASPNIEQLLGNHI